MKQITVSRIKTTIFLNSPDSNEKPGVCGSTLKGLRRMRGGKPLRVEAGENEDLQ